MRAYVQKNSSLPVSNRIIVSITERKEWQKGALFIYKDISFSDPAGDAITVINKVLSASLSGEIYDDIIQASAAEQKRGALVSSGLGCFQEFEIVIEYRIFHAAGNLSAPDWRKLWARYRWMAAAGLLAGLSAGAGE